MVELHDLFELACKDGIAYQAIETLGPIIGADTGVELTQIVHDIAAGHHAPGLAVVGDALGDEPVAAIFDLDGALRDNDRQLVLTMFFGGLTVGQLVYGPLSDALGRKPVLIVGMTALALYTTMSKARIVAIDPDPAKREAALAFGAAQAFDPGAPDATRAIVKACGGNIAAAVDFVGSEASSALAVNLVRRAGQVVIVDEFTGRTMPRSPNCRQRTARLSVSSVPQTISRKQTVLVTLKGEKFPNSGIITARWKLFLRARLIRLPGGRQ